MIGRRVAVLDDIEQAGDYCLTSEVNAAGDKVGRGLWFLLPIHAGKDKFDRPDAGSGLHRISEPPWTFRECADGSIEVRASILTHGGQGVTTWHGYLDEGHVWREC